IDRSVGLDVERELVEVGALADASLLDGVGNAADGREDRVDRDHADGLVRRLVFLRRPVAAPAADGQVELELGLLLEGGDVRVRVEDLDARGQVDVLGGDLTRAGDDHGRLDLARVGVHAAHHALEVEHDVGHVLLDALDRGELVGDALDPHAGHRGAGERGQQHPAQRVAERVAEAAVKRLDDERAAVLLHALGGYAGGLEIEHRVLLSGSCAADPAAFRGALLGVQLDDELFLHRGGDLPALGLAKHLGGEGVVVGLQPGRNLRGQLGRVADDLLRVRARLDRDHVAVSHLVRGDVHAAAVDGPVPVTDELAGPAARGRQAEPHEHVVETALEHAEKVLAGDAGLAARAVVVARELLLLHAVVALGLLLLAQLDAVLALLLTAAAVLAGRVGAPLDAALVGQAALPLEEELLALTAALLAHGSGVAGTQTR